jgi:hypothetical protein
MNVIALLLDKTLLICGNVELKAIARILPSHTNVYILPCMNLKIGPLSKEHNLYPWEFQETGAWL